MNLPKTGSPYTTKIQKIRQSKQSYMGMNLLGKPKLGKGLKLPTIVGAKTNSGSSQKSVAALIGAPKPPASSAPAAPSAAVGGKPIQSPMKVGTSLTVKTPKAKSMPDATDKPSVFFKSEQISGPKHPTVRKLRDFLDKTRSKK